MAITNTTTEQAYNGDGSTSSFAIPFDFVNAEQVKVKSLDIDTEVETIYTEGSDYTIVGTSPGTSVSIIVTPTTSQQITVYRVTTKEQVYSFLETEVFKQEDLETALDLIVMMVQELDAGIVSNTIPGGGALDKMTSQALTAAGIITTSASQRILKYVQGSGGPVTADTSTPIEDGTIDGQELRLVGLSDDDTVEILNGGNVELNGANMVFYKNSSFDFMWNDTDSKWIETSRSN
jgi:hypothetical protein